MRITRIIAAAIAITAGALTAAAQDPASKINEIKLSNNYLYAESTSMEWKDAYNNALTILSRQVSDWITKSGSSLALEDIMEKADFVKASRASLCRAFVYVPKPEEVQPKPTAEETAQQQEEAADVPVKALTEEELMREVARYEQIQDYLYSLRNKGLLLDYGKYSKLPEGPYYAFVYSKDGQIKAVLRNDIKGQINISTAQKDDIKAYLGCGAVWFRMK